MNFPIIKQIPIFVINLSSSKERRSAIESDADELGLKLSIIDAIDGRLIQDHADLGYCKRANRREYGRLLTPGEIGCYASHLKAARSVLECKAPYAIVLEDDAKLDPLFLDFLNHANQIVKEIANKASLINICNSAALKNRSKNILTTDQYSNTLHETFQFPTVARGLFWFARGAENFVRDGGIIAKPVDHYFKDWLTRQSGGYCLGEPVIGSHGFASDIGSGAGRKELSFREGLRNDFARGKRDFINDISMMKRRLAKKYFSN